MTICGVDYLLQRKGQGGSDNDKDAFRISSSTSYDIYKDVKRIIPAQFRRTDDHSRFFAVDPPHSYKPTWEAQQDWRLFRARLIAGERLWQTKSEHLISQDRPLKATDAHDEWAHLVPRAETGSLLISRNVTSGLFRCAIILVYEHGNDGSSGLIINMPAPELYIKDFGLQRDVEEAFGMCPAFIGGNVRRRFLHVLHVSLRSYIS